MKYLWTEDTGAGFHFWQLVNQLLWSIKGSLMGECWYRDCCVSNHKDHLLCGKPDLKFGDDKMKTFILSEAVQYVLQNVNDIGN